MQQHCEFYPSPGSNEIGRSILRRGISVVFHLTRIEQLPSIFRTGALLSRAKMDVLGVSYGLSGWGSAEKEEELKDYICCSIISPWGMARVESAEKALLALKPRVLLREGTLFSGRWSSYGDVSLETLSGSTDVAAFDLLFDNPDTGFPTPAPGEFLVRDCIPLNEFRPYLYVFSEASKLSIMQLCEGIYLPTGEDPSRLFKFLVNTYRFGG